MAFSASSTELSIEAKAQVQAKCHADIQKYAKVLDDHLSTRTYVVGERLGLADIALYSSFTASVTASGIQSSTFKNISRWIKTIESNPVLKPLLVTSSDGKTSSNPTGKWDRGRIRIKELLAKGVTAIGEEVVLKGWIRTVRSAEKGQVLFVELTDGSTVRGCQLVMQTATTQGVKVSELYSHTAMKANINKKCPNFLHMSY